MTPMPLVTRELVRRIVSDYGDDRVRMFAEVPGNPYAIEFHDFGQVHVILSSDPRFNVVTGLDSGDEELLDALAQFHRDRGRPLTFQIAPGFFDDRLGQRLAAHGMYQGGFRPVLYGIPQPLDLQPRLLRVATDVTVESVREQDQDLYLSVMREGINVPADFPEILHGRKWFGRPGWHQYLARVGGVAAGVGMLYVRNGTGYLVLASTLPAFRHRGCQTALLRRRIADAHALGCDLITSSASFDSISQHNLERAGLRIAYTLVDWRALPHT